ncbi:MAG: hypothetical protein ACREMY_00085 [bacterium]
MPLVGGALLWIGYTLGWFGWMAMTDRVPPGPPDHIHWPSIKDLVSPGRIVQAEIALGQNPGLNTTLAGAIPKGPTGATVGSGAGDTGNILNGVKR